MSKFGLVVGKFWPPHAGHDFLIRTAEANCGELTIMIVGQEQQQPSPQQREQWMRDLYPEHTVILVPDIYDDDSSRAWAEYTVQVLGEAPDIVFTSESYGDEWARLMGSKHMLVDIERKAFPVSGTKVRGNPDIYKHFLSEKVQKFYD